jgi:hypothetical protein
MAFQKKKILHRQPSPVLLRQSVPITLSNSQKMVNTGEHIVNGTTIINNGQQFVLVQRSNNSAPRASSAPPSQVFEFIKNIRFVKLFVKNYDCNSHNQLNATFCFIRNF